jgi:hypothetical protein
MSLLLLCLFVNTLVTDCFSGDLAAICAFSLISQASAATSSSATSLSRSWEMV